MLVLNIIVYQIENILIDLFVNTCLNYKLAIINIHIFFLTLSYFFVILLMIMISYRLADWLTCLVLLITI